MRAAFVLVHRYVGLAIAGFLVVASLTGSVLAFRSELDTWLNPGLFHVAQRGRAVPSLSHLVAGVERADRSVQAFTLALPEVPGESVSIYVGPRQDAAAPAYNQVFVDPATGDILGRRMGGAVRFDRAHLIPFLYRLHYSLHLDGWGDVLMGVVALAWMIDCFVGFYLTLPRGKPFWKKWRPIWRIKRGAGPYRLNLDLHRACGLWLWAVLFLLALSSVSLNLNREVFRPMLSALLPTSPSIWDQPAPPVPPSLALDWDMAAAKAHAEAKRRGWDGPVSTIYAGRAQGFYMVRFGRPREAGFGMSTIYVSGVDGRILSVEEAGGGKAGDVVAGLMFPVHSGQVAGLPGRILICIAGLAIAMLSITGVYVWWRKRAPRVARKRARNVSRTSLFAAGDVHAAE
ncbi:MAG: PepSY-associated TM helix domain-containing protein [Pseudomonadota bacterium]